MELLIVCPTYQQFARFVESRFPYRKPLHRGIEWIGREQDISKYSGMARNFLVYVLDERVEPGVLAFCELRYANFITFKEQP